jgi:lysylphosphatidylglycerol synthetase-like protein (DUF2156 family)
VKKGNLKEAFREGNSPKMRQTAQMMAKVFLCFLTLVWVLAFVTVALVIYDKAFYPYMINYFTPVGGEISSGYAAIVGVFCAFYIITIVLIGAFISLKGFKFVGSWKWVNQKGPDASSK